MAKKLKVESDKEEEEEEIFAFEPDGIIANGKVSNGIVPQPQSTIQSLQSQSQLQEQPLPEPPVQETSNLDLRTDQVPEVSVSDYYIKLMAGVDQVIEMSKSKKEVNIEIEADILKILQSPAQNNPPPEEWEVIHDDKNTEEKRKKLTLPVLLTPKIKIYEAHEEL